MKIGKTDGTMITLDEKTCGYFATDRFYTNWHNDQLTGFWSGVFVA